MKIVEEFGRTVEEARSKAFHALGVEEGDPDTEVEVLDEGSPGTATGWGRKFARIKVTLRREVEAPVEAPPSPRPAPKPVREPKAETEEEPAPRPAPRPAREPKPAAKKAVEEESARKAPPEESDFDDEDEEDDEEYDEDLDAPADILEDILDLMHVQASVDDDEIDGQPYLDIVGPDAALLIGKHGQTLEALQYVLNLIVNHGATERLRVTVDVSGYRQRRERTLRELAQRMARRAVDDGGPVSLEPMLPNERRIIHMALADDPEVETYSQGEEPMRKVIIAPRK